MVWAGPTAISPPLMRAEVEARLPEGDTGRVGNDPAEATIQADYHSASGYTGGALLQHAIETAGSIDADKVAATLNAMDVTTFFGHIKFATDAKHHGLQIAHEMVLAQWQMKNGSLVREVVWPDRKMIRMG
jgi:ABC-type branched-subunit amino acid transport system substrate-binding protein